MVRFSQTVKSCLFRCQAPQKIDTAQICPSFVCFSSEPIGNRLRVEVSAKKKSKLRFFKRKRGGNCVQSGVEGTIRPPLLPSLPSNIRKWVLQPQGRGGGTKERERKRRRGGTVDRRQGDRVDDCWRRQFWFQGRRRGERQPLETALPQMNFRKGDRERETERERENLLFVDQSPQKNYNKFSKAKFSPIPRHHSSFKKALGIRKGQRSSDSLWA